MRLSRKSKFFIVIAVLTIAIYCLQLHLTNVQTFLFVSNQNSSRLTNLSTSLNNNDSKRHGIKLQFNRKVNNNGTRISSNNQQTYNVWCIFTKVTSNSPMRRKFRVFFDSLVKYSSGGIAFHVITDEESQAIAERVIDYVFSVHGKKLIKVQYYNVHKSAAEIEDIVSVMSPYFSSKPGTYYSDALFFLSLGLYRIAPEDQDLAIMLDADTRLRVDIKDIFKEFEKFGEEALFGLAPELSPVYRHVLYIYRNKNPKTIFGEPGYLGGYPGYNSGVVLLHLKRLRESLEYDQIIGRDSVEHLVEKYEFKGHLGDQDFLTLLGMERPELIQTIDCGWNRQLCTWWKDRGYADVFANYSRCDSDTKLWHGNCNTPIPDS